MATDSQNDPDIPNVSEEFANAWAAVFIDAYEKLKERAELPEGDTTGQERQEAAVRDRMIVA